MNCDRSHEDAESPVKDTASDAGSIVAPSDAASTPIRRTATERKAILEADTRAVEVTPDQVLCKRCQKWIKLSKRRVYALSNWERHQLSCSDAQ